MMMLNRVSPRGRSYKLREIFGEPEKTHVQTGQKVLVVNASIRRMDVAWYMWNQGQHVQVAFGFLNPDEREFLLTGITPEEWDEMFAEDEDDENGSQVS